MLKKRYGPWVDQGPTSTDPSKVRMRVLAIPQAGMGAWAFHGWQAALPETVELLPVELPGRNSRMLEPKGQSMRQLVTALVDALTETLRETPFVVFGHSLGAWVAYELVAELLRRKQAPPLLLVVSGVRPPHLSALENDADKISPGISHLDDKEFWSHFERRYGRNPDLADSNTQQFVLPLLRADFGIVEKYTPSRTSDDPLPCPLIAACANGDNRLADGQLSQWSAYTKDGPFREVTFTTKALFWSTPHRYVLEDPKEMQKILRLECEELLKKPPPPPVAAMAAVDVSDASAASPAADKPPAKEKIVFDAPAEPKPEVVIPEIPKGETDPKLLAVLQEAGVDAAGLGDAIKGVSVMAWVVAMDASRPTFLKSLQSEYNVASLKDRQGIANKLGKAKREGRV